MISVVRAAVCAAVLSLGVQALAAEPTQQGEQPTGTQQDPRTPTDTQGQQTGQTGQPGQVDPMNLQQELGLDQETANKVNEIMTNTRQQHQTYYQQKQQAIEQLRTAEQAGDQEQMASAIEKLQDVGDKMRNLEEQARDRVLGALNTQQKADFILYMYDRRNDRMFEEQPRT